MNQSIPSCKLDITPVGPWFLLRKVEVEMPDDLMPARFARFDYGLDLAGRSASGRWLSVKRSAGPAKIGPYPILATRPPNWVAFPAQAPALLLRTNQPRLAFIGIPTGPYWPCQFYEALAVAGDDLAEIVDIGGPPDREPQSSDVAVDVLSPEIAKLIARYASQLKVVILSAKPHIRFPKGLSLGQDEWKLLARHIVTGKAAACVEDTVPRRQDSHDLIGLPGSSLAKVIARYGIGDQKPCAFDGRNLLFKSIHVQDAAKLSCLFPRAKLLGGRLLRVARGMELRQGYDLQQAAEAGAIPLQGEVMVDPLLKRIFLNADQVKNTALKEPLEFGPESPYGRAGLLCPEHLLQTCVMSVAEAVRTYDLPPGLTKYEVRTLDPVAKAERHLPGTFYLTSDLASLPRRDPRRERAERKARAERLIARYGHNLPPKYEQHTDQEVSVYYEIKDLVARGDLVSVEKHPLLPENIYRRDEFLRWIKQVKPALVITCPVTGTCYLRPLGGIEDLAGLPGIWQEVEKLFGEPSWLRLLVLSPRIRASALADAI